MKIKLVIVNHPPTPEQKKAHAECSRIITDAARQIVLRRRKDSPEIKQDGDVERTEGYGEDS